MTPRPPCPGKTTFKKSSLISVKDFTKRRASDNVLHDKAFSIAKNLKYDGYQCGLALLVHTFLLDKGSFKKYVQKAK